MVDSGIFPPESHVRLVRPRRRAMERRGLVGLGPKTPWTGERRSGTVRTYRWRLRDGGRDLPRKTTRRQRVQLPAECQGLPRCRGVVETSMSSRMHRSGSYDNGPSGSWCGRMWAAHVCRHPTRFACQAGCGPVGLNEPGESSPTRERYGSACICVTHFQRLAPNESVGFLGETLDGLSGNLSKGRYVQDDDSRPIGIQHENLIVMLLGIGDMTASLGTQPLVARCHSSH